MLWLTIVVQWLHIFLGIFWFGSTLHLDFVVIPAVLELPQEQQPGVSRRISQRGLHLHDFDAFRILIFPRNS